jgi:hypothetical protein
MVFHLSSDASYLTAPKARSRAAGYHYLRSRPIRPRPTAPSYGSGPTKQWRHPCYVPHHARSPFQRRRSRTRWRISQWQRGLSFTRLPHHRRPYKLTTARLPVSPTTASNKNAPKPWTCVFIGFETAFAKANFWFISEKAARTVPIFLPSIIQHRIIKPSGPRIYIRQLIGPKTISNAFKIRIMPKLPTPLLPQSQ